MPSASPTPRAPRPSCSRLTIVTDPDVQLERARGDGRAADCDAERSLCRGPVRIELDNRRGVPRKRASILSLGRHEILSMEGGRESRAYARSPSVSRLPRSLANPAARRDVGARTLTGPHAPSYRARHLPMRYEAGLPSWVNRFRMLHARTASLPCPAGLRARRLSPMTDLYRKNAFSTPPADDSPPSSSTGAGRPS